MAHYRCSVESPLTPEAAFDYVADFRNFEEWDPGVSSSTLESGSEPGMGTSYAVTANGADLVYRTMAFDRPSRTEIEAKSKLLRSYDVVEVVARPDGGSTVTYDATLELNGPLGLLDPVLGLFFNRIADKAAGGLESALNGTIVAKS